MNYKNILKLSSIYFKYAAYWNPKGAGAAGILLVCSEDNTIFLTKRSRRVQQPNTWGNQGGAVDPKEDQILTDDTASSVNDYSGNDMSMNGALREAVEELGSLPKGMKLLAQTTFSDRGFTYKTYIFDISLEDKENWTPTVTLNWENSEAKWFPNEQEKLPRPLHPGIIAIPGLLTEDKKDLLNIPTELDEQHEYEDEGDDDDDDEDDY